MPKPALVVCVAMFAVARADALVTLHDVETYGNERRIGSCGLAMNISVVLNAPGRDYWRDRSSTGFDVAHSEIVAAYRGDARQLNNFLAILADLPKSIRSEVILVPGSGSLNDKEGRPVRCDWRARLTYHHNYSELRPRDEPSEALAIHVELFVPDLPEPTVPVSAKQLNAWIDELDHKQFPVREQAQRRLARQGISARDALRQGLDTNPTHEKKRRLEQLLEAFATPQLAEIQPPKHLPIRSFDQLVAREWPRLLAKEPTVRWDACQRLHNAIEGSPALLTLLASLLDDDALAIVQRQAHDAPKDYLRAFKPLLDAKPLTPATRTEHSATFRDVRQRLDRFCR